MSPSCEESKEQGGRIGFIPEPVITSARRWEQEGILYTTLRNWLLLSAYTLGVEPDKLVKYYKEARGVAKNSTGDFPDEKTFRNVTVHPDQFPPLCEIHLCIRESSASQSFESRRSRKDWKSRSIVPAAFSMR